MKSSADRGRSASQDSKKSSSRSRKRDPPGEAEPMSESKKTRESRSESRSEPVTSGQQSAGKAIGKKNHLKNLVDREKSKMKKNSAIGPFNPDVPRTEVMPLVSISGMTRDDIDQEHGPETPGSAEVPEQRPQPPAIVFKFDVAKDRKSFDLFVQKAERIGVFGCFSISIDCGVVDINGFTCSKGDTFHISCPNNCTPVTITGVEAPDSDIGAFAVLTVRQLEQNPTSPITQYSTFSRLFDNNHGLQVPVDFRVFLKESSLRTYSEIEEVAECAQPRDKIMICGSKNFGKTTSCIWLVNKLLSSDEFNQVLWLDFDVGQPEFTAPGCVSLMSLTEPVFGTSYTHLRQPVKSYFVGSVSMVDNLAVYFNAVQKLLSDLEDVGVGCPVVVNMPGWVEIGMGLEITSDLIRLVKPSVVVQFISDSDPKTMPLTPEVIQSSKGLNYVKQSGSPPFKLELIHVQGAHKSPKFVSISPRLERQLRLLSYFHQGRCEPVHTLKLPSVEVCFSEKTLEVMPFAELPPDLILMTFMSQVVTFCSRVDYHGVPDIINQSGLRVAKRECQLKNLRCVIGHGIVVSLDLECRVMRVVTPLSEEDVNSCAVISKGALHIPNCVLTSTSPREKSQRPYVTTLFPKELFGASGSLRRSSAKV